MTTLFLKEPFAAAFGKKCNLPTLLHLSLLHPKQLTVPAPLTKRDSISLAAYHRKKRGKMGKKAPRITVAPWPPSSALVPLKLARCQTWQEVHPLKINMTMEKQPFEDVSPIKIGDFSGAMLVFLAVGRAWDAPANLVCSGLARPSKQSCIEKPFEIHALKN